MDEQINIITLIALIVAVVAILKLRSVLGRRTDDDDSRVERHYREGRESEEMGQGNDNVVTLPNVRGNDTLVQKDPEDFQKDAEDRIRAYAGNNKDIAKGLLGILKKDANFDPETFVNGASHAYELIVTAYAEGNRSELKKLLDKEVYDSFNRAISERERRGELIDQSFVGIEKANIIEADNNNGTASITMRFVSQLISATRDRDGGVISGDTQRIKEVTDIWIFNRDVSSQRALANPNWKLIETQSQQ